MGDQAILAAAISVRELLTSSAEDDSFDHFGCSAGDEVDERCERWEKRDFVVLRLVDRTGSVKGNFTVRAVLRVSLFLPLLLDTYIDTMYIYVALFRS